ncbi:hypothetical protein DFH05DRAFT_1529439 [Lentinula detonsa]|uniref:Uncharacterized protein n=1 Tax=Lentinula detonsa TaxID=2804962 RepID=A0A9W8NSU4_9AGAR|nr:hypothetical protein DFH05DRAFT_1529439 [Lentinula detonsa]
MSAPVIFPKRNHPGPQPTGRIAVKPPAAFQRTRKAFFFLINQDSHDVLKFWIRKFGSYLELGIGSSSPSQQNGVEFNGVDASLPSPGAESVSTGAACSDDNESDEDDDEGAEENERVDENGPIVIDDDDDDDEDTPDDDQEYPLIVKDKPSPSSAVIELLNDADNGDKNPILNQPIKLKLPCLRQYPRSNQPKVQGES